MPLRREPPPRPEELRHRLGYLRLDFDVLRRVADLLAARGGRLNIRAGDAYLDDLDEISLVTRSERHQLSLESSDPRVRVDLGHHETAVTSLQETPASRALAEECKQLLENYRTRRPQGMYAQMVYVGLAGMIFMVPALTTNVIDRTSTQALWVLGSYAFTFLFAPIAFYFIGWQSGCASIDLGAPRSARQLGGILKDLGRVKQYAGFVRLRPRRRRRRVQRVPTDDD